MSIIRRLIAKLFSPKNRQWDTMDFGKPSTESDDFRKRNES